MMSLGKQVGINHSLALSIDTAIVSFEFVSYVRTLAYLNPEHQTMSKPTLSRE